ncbi:unnamed protein product, partial [Durusdinium trenchii]
GELVILRLPGEAFYRDNLAFGSLHFSDGSQKTLACFAVFIALHLAATLPGNADQLTHPSVQGLLASMLRIPTLVKGSVGVSSDVDSAVSQIVKQNLDSKVQPVSALAWVSILRSLGSDVGADGLIAKYNDHPEVVAMEQSGGVGSIGIDKKKMQAVKNLLDATGAAALSEMQQSVHDFAFSYGPFGDQFCQLPFIYVGSTAKLDPINAQDAASDAPQPLPREPFCSLDWDLQLSEEGQFFLFRRVRTTFNRVTGLVPMAQKKRYRMSPDELFRVRNLIAFFQQIVGHLRARLDESDVREWIEEVTCGLSRDEDLQHLVNLRPPNFSLSMLLSQQQQARKSMEVAEQEKMEAVAQQRQEVQEAQWTYFKTALAKDHDAISRVSGAPAAIRQRLHAKQVKHRNSMVKDTYLRVVSADKMDLARAEISQMKLDMARELECPLDQICTVGIVDFNVPTARQKAAASSLVNAVSLINDTGVAHNNCVLMTLPDLAKDSSLRGLYDEEKMILESCFGLRQNVESRWIDLYTRDRRVDRSSMRRFGAGRIAVNHQSTEKNIWLSSELAVCGRPTAANETERGAPCAVLPKSSSLLLPEASSPNADLKLAERTRPSPEQSAAQKGCQRHELLLESLFRHVPMPGSQTAVLIVNFTGYVEEVLNLRLRGVMQGEGGGFDFSRAFYLSVHTLDNDSGFQYAKMRELKTIPGADCVQSIDKLKLEVCVRQGTTIVIHPDQCKQWSNSGSEIAEAFAELKKNHTDNYSQVLSSIISTPGQSASQVSGTSQEAAAALTDAAEPETSDPGPAVPKVTFESIDKLKEKEEIEVRCASEVSGVELIKCRSGKIFLCSDKKRVVPKSTLLGGYGTGKHFESTQIETLTIYRLLVLLEKTKKISQYKVTYSECKRTDAATGNDGFQLTISEACQLRRSLTQPVSNESEVAAGPRGGAANLAAAGSSESLHTPPEKVRSSLSPLQGDQSAKESVEVAPADAGSVFEETDVEEDEQTLKKPAARHTPVMKRPAAANSSEPAKPEGSVESKKNGGSKMESKEQEKLVEPRKGERKMKRPASSSSLPVPEPDGSKKTRVRSDPKPPKEGSESAFPNADRMLKDASGEWEDLLEGGTFRSHQFIDLVPGHYPTQEDTETPEPDTGNMPEVQTSEQIRALKAESMPAQSAAPLDSPPPLVSQPSSFPESTSTSSSSRDGDEVDSHVDQEKQSSSSYGPIRRRVDSKSGAPALYRPPVLRQDDFVEIIKEALPQLLEDAISGKPESQPSTTDISMEHGQKRALSPDSTAADEPATNRARHDEVLTVEEASAGGVPPSLSLEDSGTK